MDDVLHFQSQCDSIAVPAVSELSLGTMEE